MKIACVGYFTKENRITVSYDTVDEKYIVDEIYLDRDIGVTVGFSYSVKSKEGVRESLERFKKDFVK